MNTARVAMTPAEVDALAYTAAASMAQILVSRERIHKHAAALRVHAADAMGLSGDPLEAWTLEELMAYADLAPTKP